MSRSLWFVAGAGAGVYALAKTRRIAEAFTPDGLADRLAGLSLGARLFREEVLDGAAEAEPAVRGRLGLDPGVHQRQLTAPPQAAPAGAAPPDPPQTREATH